MSKLLRFLLLLLVFSAWQATAQTLDPSFAPTTLTQERVNGFTIRKMLKQPDGKVIVGGGYDFVDGVLTSKIRRLNADGSLDTAFLAQTGSGPDIGVVQALALQPDGKIVAGVVSMTYYNGVYASGIVRLNPDGSVDATFNAGGTGIRTLAYYNPFVRSLAVQPDGKILVGITDAYGTHTYNGQPLNGLIRLNPNGSIDTSFNIGTGMQSSSTPSFVTVAAIFVQADGKIVVGGDFNSVNGTPVNNLVRLNSNGTLDNSFAIGSGLAAAYNGVRSILQQPDGRLLIAGAFSELNGVPCSNLIRLNLNGTLDNSFTGGANGIIQHLWRKVDGSLLVTGSFTSVNGVPRGRIAQVSSTGTLDPAFASGTGATDVVFGAVELNNGQVLIGGHFTAYNGMPRTGLARLSSTAVLDASYNPVHRGKGSVYLVVPLPNGQLMALTSTDNFNGTPISASDRGSIILNADGTYAGTGNVTGPSNYNRGVAMYPDGRRYALNVDYQTYTATFARTSATGVLDPTFTPVVFRYPNGYAELKTITTSASGVLLFTGDFTSVNGIARPGFARVLSNGTLDAAFTPPSLWTTPNNDYNVKTIDLPSGKVLVSWNGADRSHVVMLTSTGNPDPAFSVGMAAGPTGLFDVVLQPDGRLLITTPHVTHPTFNFNGYAAPNGLLRLLPTGAPDPSFVPALALRRLYLQPDGRIIGTENSFSPANQLRRLNADGTIDASFTAVSVPESVYYYPINYVLQPSDGKILLYGDFTTVNGQTRIGLARLTNTLLATRPAFAAAPELDVYPNPAQHQVTLRLPASAVSPTARAVELLDMQGRTVRHFTLPARQTEASFDLADVAAGIYWLQTGTGQGIPPQRVVVAH